MTQPPRPLPDLPPVIAVLLGSLVLHESVTGRMLIAGAVTIGGIVLLTLPDRRPRDA